jgi:hypothetical protein
VKGQLLNPNISSGLLKIDLVQKNISPQTRAYLANKCQTPFFIPQHKNTK